MSHCVFLLDAKVGHAVRAAIGTHSVPYLLFLRHNRGRRWVAGAAAQIVERQVAVVNLKREGREGGRDDAAPLLAPRVLRRDGWIPASRGAALAALRFDQRLAHLAVPSVPARPDHIVHRLRSVIPVISVPLAIVR